LTTKIDDLNYYILIFLKTYLVKKVILIFLPHL